MKNKLIAFTLACLLVPVFIAPVILLPGCGTPAATAAYKTIGALEASVINANGAYLDGVVTGKVPTNDVPKVEAEFNATQLALHAAAALASAGTNAPASAAVTVQAQTFITHAAIPIK